MLIYVDDVSSFESTLFTTVRARPFDPLRSYCRWSMIYRASIDEMIVAARHLLSVDFYASTLRAASIVVMFVLLSSWPLNRGLDHWSSILFFKFRSNWALISCSGPKTRHRNFRSVIGPLAFEAAFYYFFCFNFKFNRALISRSGAMVWHRNFKSVIASLNRGLRPLKQHFI